MAAQYWRRVRSRIHLLGLIDRLIRHACDWDNSVARSLSTNFCHQLRTHANRCILQMGKSVVSSFDHWRPVVWTSLELSRTWGHFSSRKVANNMWALSISPCSASRWKKLAVWAHPGVSLQITRWACRLRCWKAMWGEIGRVYKWGRLAGEQTGITLTLDTLTVYCWYLLHCARVGYELWSIMNCWWSDALLWWCKYTRCGDMKTFNMYWKKRQFCNLNAIGIMLQEDAVL